MLAQKQPETHYIATYLARVFGLIFEQNDSINITWWVMFRKEKPSADYSTYRGDASLPEKQDEERRAQLDDERRSKGNAPDAIFTLKSMGVSFALIEVSGGPTCDDHGHFVGDRVKLAKSLKCLLKKIRNLVSHGSEEVFADIKLVGIQIYSKFINLSISMQPLTYLSF